MKILIFHTYNQGYLSNFFHELAVRLMQEGHEVTSFSWKATESRRIIDHIKVIVKKKEGYLINYHNIYSIIKEEKPDVILSNFSYVNPALLFGKLFGVRKGIVWFHSLNDQTGATYSNIFIKRLFLRLADIIIANSHHTKEELHQEFKVPKLKIKTIPFWSPINQETDDFGEVRNTDILKIGCPGRLVEHKNQKIVLEALTYYNKEDFKFHIAGNGPNKGNLVELAQQLGLVDQVVFRGHLSADEMFHFYKDMDVIVLPSLAEAFGLVFIEAISLGTPVIVSSQFGALTFIENKKDLDAISFDPKSVEALKMKLTPYFNNNNKLSSDYFKNLYSKNFDKEIIYKQLQKIILGGEK